MLKINIEIKSDMTAKYSSPIAMQALWRKDKSPSISSSPKAKH